MNSWKAFSSVTDAELDLARRDSVSASSFLSQSLETLLATLQILRNASLACATSAKQIREGVQSSPPNSFKPQPSARTTIELNPTILPFSVGRV
jgi:hypothetical protein